MGVLPGCLSFQAGYFHECCVDVGVAMVCASFVIVVIAMVAACPQCLTHLPHTLSLPEVIYPQTADRLMPHVPPTVSLRNSTSRSTIISTRHIFMHSAIPMLSTPRNHHGNFIDMHVSGLGFHKSHHIPARGYKGPSTWFVECDEAATIECLVADARCQIVTVARPRLPHHLCPQRSHGHANALHAKRHRAW